MYFLTIYVNFEGNYLLTSIRDPRNRGEERYNARHKRARSVVEQAFRLLKTRFLCLHKFRGCLVYSPERCIRIITDCLILHNICIDHNIQIANEDNFDEIDEEEQEIPDEYEHDEQIGLDVRNELIRLRFSD